jgi:hypothetical protein
METKERIAPKEGDRKESFYNIERIIKNGKPNKIIITIATSYPEWMHMVVAKIRKFVPNWEDTSSIEDVNAKAIQEIKSDQEMKSMMHKALEFLSILMKVALSSL